MSRIKSIAPLAALTLSLVLSACASYSGIHTEGVKLEANALGAKDIKAEWPQSDWWLSLNDETLNHLIDDALRGNPGLKEADARLQKAKAIAGVIDSARYPQVNANLSSTRERFSENGTTPPPYAGTTQSINDLSLNASWELDFFGRNGEAVQAALGELRATEAEHQAARIMLSADVAQHYFALARLQQQLQIAEQQNQQRGKLLELEQSRVQAGIDAPGDLEPLKSGVAENRRDSAALDEQIAQARHAIAALLGRGPDATNELHAALPPVNQVALPQELPIELLGRRADIVAARWRVESNLHGMESTKALFYPNINLRGFAGFSSIGFGDFLDAGSRQPGLGIAITLPIFDADRLRNQY
ncbi:MAG TPA: efflux transporter outer membrane subunit, partial [Rhodocyclaceae bacterium]|nr:efflux transporter outer membrane subunit [Rhodocyclaceae bacterium]